MKYSSKKMLKAVKALKYGCLERSCDNCILNDRVCNYSGILNGVTPEQWQIDIPSKAERKAWEKRRRREWQKNEKAN